MSPLISYGQETIYYKYIYSVDPKTGVKKSTYNSPQYYTFVNKYRYVYESDARGNQTSHMNIGFYCDYVYKYVGEKNGMFVYACKWTQNLGYVSSSGTYYITFSKDLHRINLDYGYEVCVGEKSELPGQEAPPSKMW